MFLFFLEIFPVGMESIGHAHVRGGRADAHIPHGYLRALVSISG